MLLGEVCYLLFSLFYLILFATFHLTINISKKKEARIDDKDGGRMERGHKKKEERKDGWMDGWMDGGGGGNGGDHIDNKHFRVNH